MPIEFTVTLENRPGTLAELSEALGEAEVNIRALAGMVCEGKGIIKLVSNDDDAMRSALSDLEMPFEEREILTVTLPDQPGALGRLANALGKAGVNIDAIYVADMHDGYTEIALGVDDVAEASALIPSHLD